MVGYVPNAEIFIVRERMNVNDVIGLKGNRMTEAQAPYSVNYAIGPFPSWERLSDNGNTKGEAFLTGKGWFIWWVNRLAKTPKQIAEHAHLYNYSHLTVKIADEHDYPINIVDGRDYAKDLVEACKPYNIKVWGWHYVTGDFPVDEADLAYDRMLQTGCQGYIINAEGEYRDRPNNAATAKLFLEILRGHMPDIPIALSSYRYPELHYQMPWFTWFENGVDIAMPQVYWLYQHNPSYQLQKSLSQYEKYDVPIYPTGAAYTQGEWHPTVQDVNEFMNECVDQLLPAFNFYRWGHGYERIPEVGAAIDLFEMPITPPPPLPSICPNEERVSENERQIASIWDWIAAHDAEESPSIPDDAILVKTKQLTHYWSSAGLDSACKGQVPNGKPILEINEGRIESGVPILVFRTAWFSCKDNKNDPYIKAAGAILHYRSYEHPEWYIRKDEVEVVEG